MVSFNRHIWEDLLRWKSQAIKKPLVLRGARQVGKTTVIRNFGKEYKHYIELNLEKRDDYELIENSRSVQDVAGALALKHEIPSNRFSDTLLFIDEIQESPKAISYLRYFFEELPERSEERRVGKECRAERGR